MAKKSLKKETIWIEQETKFIDQGFVTTETDFLCILSGWKRRRYILREADAKGKCFARGRFLPY